MGSSGGIGSLLDVARRALNAQTQALRVVGSNVANVNTPGYSRRQAELVSVSPASFTDPVGAGVEVNRIVRKVDTFLNGELLNRINDTSQFDIKNELLSRAEQPFSLDNPEGKIGTQLARFFSALEDLSTSPSDIPLRTRVIDEGRALTASINSTFSSLSTLQREADSRVGVLVSDVNRISGQIRDLNEQIGDTESDVQENLTLRDQRDELLRQLAAKVTVRTVDNGDGTITVSLENGFALVNGNSQKNLEFVNGPSFAPVGGFPKGLDNSELGHIVFNFGSSSSRSDIDLTSVVAAGGGEISGLLKFRGIQALTDTSPFDANGEIVEVASRVEALARDLLTRVNTTYLGPDEDGGTAGHQASSGDRNGNSPGVYGLFTFGGATDTNADGLPNDLATNLVNTYASEIDFGVSDQNEVAVALDLNPAPGAKSFAPGDGSNISNLIALRTQSVNYSVGNFTASASIEGLYQTTASYVGGLKNTAANSLAVAKDRETQVKEFQQSVSGVNMDEEFASLINYQRAFEASARIIHLGDSLLDQVLQLLG